MRSGNWQSKHNDWRGKSWLFSWFSSVSHIHKVAQHQMKLIRARCCMQSGPSQPSKQCSIWPKWNIGILSQNPASRLQFFRYKPSKQVISQYYIDKQVIYCLFPARELQTLSAWRKVQDNFAKYCRYWYARWLQWIASVMQRLLPWSLYLCWDCWVIQVVGWNLEIPLCVQQCSEKYSSNWKCMLNVKHYTEIFITPVLLQCWLLTALALVLCFISTRNHK